MRDRAAWHRLGFGCPCGTWRRGTGSVSGTHAGPGGVPRLGSGADARPAGVAPDSGPTPRYGCISLSCPPSAAAAQAINAPITIASAVKIEAAELALRAVSAA
jgi:hypothetical protein